MPLFPPPVIPPLTGAEPLASGESLYARIASQGGVQLVTTQLMLTYWKAATTGSATGVTTLTGQVAEAHGVEGSGTPTGVTSGTGCGTPSAATITGGHDGAGQIGITCGTAGSNGNNFVTATFAVAYSTTAPVCVISCANAATCAGEVLSDHQANPTTTNIAVKCAGGTCTTGTLLWNYICRGI